MLVMVSPETNPETKSQGQIIYLEGARHTSREEKSEPGNRGPLKSHKLSRALSCGQLKLNPASVEHMSRGFVPEGPGNWGARVYLLPCLG